MIGRAGEARAAADLRRRASKPSISGHARVEQHERDRAALARRRAPSPRAPPGAARDRASGACASASAPPRGCGGWWRCRPRRARAGRAAAPGEAGAPARGRAAPPKRDGEVEAAAAARLALDRDAAAHQRRRAAAEIVRPRPGAAVLRASSSRRPARRPRRCAPASPAGCRCRCRAPRSASTTLGLAPRLHARPRTTTSPLLGELDGVADQVDEDLAQPRRVADQAARARRGRSAQASSSPFWCARRPSVRSVSPSALAQVELRRRRARACPPRSSRSRGCR